MFFNFIAVFFFCLFLISCSGNNIGENKNLQTIAKPPLHSVTGEVCPLSENDIFALENKNNFSECDVRKNPNLFNGKIIRIKSNYSFMIHGSFFSDMEKCSKLSKSIDELISVELSESDFDLIAKASKFSSGFPLAIEAVGKFSVSTPSKQSDSIYDRTPYHFEIVCLEKAGSVGK